LSGFVTVEIVFVRPGGRRYPIRVKCALAPEFDGGVLISMPSMESLGVCITLDRGQRSIFFKKWKWTLPVSGASAATSMCQLHAVKARPTPCLKADSAVLAYCREQWGGYPSVIPEPQADEFLSRGARRQLWTVEGWWFFLPCQRSCSGTFCAITLSRFLFLSQQTRSPLPVGQDGF